MGTEHAGRLTAGAASRHAIRATRVRRPRWRSYLLLSRVSNVPTVWTNVLAGMAASGAVLAPETFLKVGIAISLFYVGGMFLNDAFDEPFDRKARPERPIPSGDVSRREVFLAGGGLLVAGELLLAPAVGALLLGAALAAAILLYDRHHKGSSVAPLVMGLCRGLVYVVAAASAAGVTAAALVSAAAITSYVAGLTVVAKLAGPNARWLIPCLIAGISIVDAVVVGLMSSSIVLALLTAAGFPLTLFLQRYVPGD